MSITEEQPQAGIARSHRPRLRARSPRRAVIRSIDNRKPPHGPSSAIGDDRLVYAVCRSGPAPSCATREQKIDHRFVQEDVSDEMLLKNVAGGDKAAMHIIFARHRERVSRFIQRLARNPAVVDDLVNQVFLDVWRSASRFENRARVATWLLSIARFKAISTWRERTHEDIDQADALGVVDTGDRPDMALDREETKGILRACIDRLSPAHREIIELLYYREKSVAEVSGMIGIPQATVKSRIFYARKHLARILMEAGFGAADARTSFGCPSPYAAGK
ncbi:sigma-70 family RNA polymerase sigma factor [uncultured Bradyrhizobium sp.]|jgi:RNA polymerase sigma-70 factor (ECF subfamily)|uniref:sigma-70 family RNA polymerase sigma factor n=1 Tax=uncultured Bradyrhizobium sp. TaxID=199684 RepID=UPI00262A9CAE|nr:sigma-70 family RNA polymerase sigma factor [uncultured Bradyrhizobium sp.]